MFVKPAPNTLEPEVLGALLRVRDPATGRLLPPEGSNVPNSPHWLRLLRDGDVVLAEPPGSEPHEDPAVEPRPSETP
jgi:hypothetical protein